MNSKVIEDVIPTDGFARLKENPGAVVNVDSSGLKAYKLRRNQETRRSDEINNIKQEMNDIKSMLSHILEKLDK